MEKKCRHKIDNCQDPDQKLKAVPQTGTKIGIICMRIPHSDPSVIRAKIFLAYFSVIVNKNDNNVRFIWGYQ
jgi:hypothetical protein